MKRMKPACPRFFEAEALRDGRLTGAEVARCRAHVRVCRVCAREARALEQLADALRATSCADELHVRRERTRLLAAFDAAMVPAAPVGPARSWRAIAAGVTALLAVVLAVALVAWPSRPLPHDEDSTAMAVVDGDGGARWSRHLADGVERIVLESGGLSIRVDRPRSGRRLLVILPDGELEDIGTTFTVSVAQGQTTRISVQDGSVVLRLRGNAPVVLGAGEAWTPRPKAPLPPLVPLAPRASLEPTPSVAGSASAATARPPGAPRSRSEDPVAASEFRSAMAAFDAGHDARAAALFARFVARHPRDARTEDAAYLRVLSLERAGDTAGMRRAAREYLTRFPRAFRRAEVERLSE